jgi:hypothetical protein
MYNSTFGSSCITCCRYPDVFVKNAVTNVCGREREPLHRSVTQHASFPTNTLCRVLKRIYGPKRGEMTE